MDYLYVYRIKNTSNINVSKHVTKKKNYYLLFIYLLLQYQLDW